MKIKLHFKAILTALVVFGGFFVLTAEKAEAYMGPFFYTGTIGNNTNVFWSQSWYVGAEEVVNVYNSTPQGGQNLNGVPYSIKYWPAGVDCIPNPYNSVFFESSGAYGSTPPTDWVSLSNAETPNPSGNVPPAGYTAINVDVNTGGQVQNYPYGGRYCATVTFGTTEPASNPNPGPLKANIILSMGGAVGEGCTIKSFEAAPSSVASGGSSALSWSTSGCTSASLNGGVFNNKSENHQVALGFENTGPLTNTTSYTLTASGGGVTVTATVVVTVNGAGGCTITSFNASPLSVPSGGTSTLSWTTSNCTSGTLNGGAFNNFSVTPTISNGSQNSGSITVDTQYTLTAYGTVGSDTKNVTVTVGGGACTIDNIGFTVNGGTSATVAPNAPVVIGWSVPASCASGTLTRVSGPNDVGLNQSANGAGTRNAQTSNLGTTVYRLSVQPGSITIDRSVTVSDANACTITIFKASPDNIMAGNTSTLQWTTNNCTWAVLNGGSFSSKSENHQVASGSEFSGVLNTTTGYSLLAGNATSSDSENVTVVVNDGGPCRIDTFYASPANTSYGGNVNLYWTTTNCTSGTLNGGAFSNLNVSAQIVSGNRNTGSLTSAQNYTLNASGPGGSDSKTVRVNLANTECAGYAFTFTANGYTNVTVQAGQPVTLAWNIPTECSSARLEWAEGGNDIGLVVDNVSIPTGTYGASTAVSGTTTRYNLTVQPGDIVKSVNVTVQPSMTCTIVVNSLVNGSPAVPSGGFNFSITNGYPADNISDSLSSTPSKSFPGHTAGYVYTATIPTGFSAPAVYSSITPANSQTCNINSTVTFTYNFTTPSPPGDPTAPGGPAGTNPVAENTALNAAVACGQVRLTWGAGTNATSYRIFRNTTNTIPGAPWQTGIVATTYTDTSPLTGSYYWVQSVNGSGNSAAVAAANTPISPTNCQVNLGTSGKVVTAVDGQPYTFSSSCIPGQTGSVKTINNNDVISFSINVCNTGTLDATSVSITDDLTNSNLYNIRNVVITGGGSHSTAGSTTTFNLGTITAGTKKTITFDADVVAPVGGTQTLYRFRNIGNLAYTSSGGTAQLGCVGTYATVANPCRLDTGYIVFYNGQGSPIIKEVAP